MFAVLGAVIWAKTRSAAGAVVFSLIALVLFVAMPMGRGVPGAIGALISEDAAQSVLESVWRAQHRQEFAEEEAVRRYAAVVARPASG